MRIALLHNPSAGAEDHSLDELSGMIRSAGHDVRFTADRIAELTAALHRDPCELVVVAGGDGTVGRVACALAGWRVPLSIVPLGTANNTARCLGLPESGKKLAKSWSTAKPVAFDLGLLGDGVLRHRFAEAAGWGVFPETIALAKRKKRSGVAQTLRRDRKLFRDTVRAMAPRPYGIEIDGRDVSGDYILVEVMNISLLGPRLALSSASDPGDGQLELVLAGAEQRAALEQLAKTGEIEVGALRLERGNQIRIQATQGLHHRDGRVERHALGARSFELGVEAAAVSYLV
ncbi:MAG TPA: diacylglycerol kinase family protein [Polyangiaceae bacterium]|nr:diacylglycerol kinase family protein [Polyangiaceae bacterium]